MGAPDLSEIEGMRVTADPDDAARVKLDAGTCPGWMEVYSYRRETLGLYRNGWTACRAKASRGDLCGTHDNARAKVVEKYRRTLAQRARDREAAAAHSLALNLAMMLTDAARLNSTATMPWVTFDAVGPLVTLDAANAQALLDWLRAI